MRSVLENLEELWDENQYEAEFGVTDSLWFVLNKNIRLFKMMNAF